MKNSSAIGIIGIGVMGMSIAKNLHRKGYDVAVRDIRPEAEQEARSAGMMVYASPAALAVAASLIVIVVVNAQQIDDVLFGADGVMQADAKGKTVMICSTIAPEDTIRYALRLQQHSIATIDAPISGGPARAEAGTMTMMIAGTTCWPASIWWRAPRRWRSE
jgi:L-threonate 2-dehydrogenase